MAILVTQDGVVHQLDPSWTGRWAGEKRGAGYEPDRCYYCGIGQRPEAVGYVTDGGTRYGLCEAHAGSRHPESGVGVFVRYPVVGLRTALVPARTIRAGMWVIVQSPVVASPRLVLVNRVERLDGRTKRLHIKMVGSYLSVDDTANVERAYSRFE